MSNETSPDLTKNDEQIDEFGRYFLCVVVQKLDEVLVQKNVNPDDRRSICSLFADNFASFLDFGWLDNGEEKLWPLLAFAERTTETSEDVVGNLERIVVPSRESFHGEGGSEGAVTFHFDNDDEAKEWMSFESGLRGD